MNDRRKFLIGASSIGLTALAGCTGSSGTDSENNEATTTASGNDADETTASGDDGGSANAFKIGVLLPFSGEYAWVGENVYPVAEMVANEINNQGGIDGQDISLVQGDTEGSPSASLSAAKKLINVEEVAGIIGPTSITMSAVFDLFIENQVPVVTPTAGTTSLDTRGGEFVYRTVPSDALGGRAISTAIRNEEFNTEQDYSNMALMVGNKEVFQSFKDPILNSFEEAGGTVTEVVDFKTGKPSYQSEVQTVMNSDPGITTLVGSKDDSIKIMRAAFQAGYEGNWFVTQDQTTEVFLEESSEKVTNGILGIQSAPYQEAKDSGRIEGFQQRFEEHAGKKPGLFARNAFDAMNVMGLAMKATVAAGSDVTSANVASNIQTVANPPETVVTDYTTGASELDSGSTINYRGLVGPIDFDEDGDVSAPFAILQADGKSWADAATIQPSDL